MNNHPKATSISAKLLKLAKAQGVLYQNLLTAFLIERLAVRLVADSQLNKSLIFKGGFVSLRVYNSSRFTIDLDAILKKSDLTATLEKTKLAIQSELDDGVWFQFEKQVDLKTQGEYGGIRQTYRAGLGLPPKNIKKAQVINFDLGIGDPVDPIRIETLEILGGAEISWLVYPVENIVAEKLHALIDRGSDSSRSKDIFDLSLFLGMADFNKLSMALSECFKYRKTDLPESLFRTVKKINTATLKMGWSSAMTSVKNPPDFDTAFAEVVRQLKLFDAR